MVAIAARSGELLNYNSVAQDVGVSTNTVKRWVAILKLQALFICCNLMPIIILNAPLKRLMVYMFDIGLMAYLTKWLTPETIQQGAKVGNF